MPPEKKPLPKCAAMDSVLIWKKKRKIKDTISAQMYCADFSFHRAEPINGVTNIALCLTWVTHSLLTLWYIWRTNSIETRKLMAPNIRKKA